MLDPNLSDKEKSIHESRKITRHHLAHAHFILSNRVQWMFEEFQEAGSTISVLQSMCEQIQRDIEAVVPPEAPKPEGQVKPMEVMAASLKLAPEIEAGL